MHLTPTEFDLLALLAGAPRRRAHSREQLLAEVWGWRDGAGQRTVDSHIRGLRRKLGSDLVRTVHGVGYALEPMRPLDRLPSIKVKLGVVIVATVVGHRRRARDRLPARAQPARLRTRARRRDRASRSCSSWPAA